MARTQTIEDQLLHEWERFTSEYHDRTAATDERLIELENRLNRQSMAGLGGWTGAPANDEQRRLYAAWSSAIAGRPVDRPDTEAIRDYTRAFDNYIRRGNLASSSSTALLNEMSVGSDPDGGYLVAPDLTGRIATLIRERSPLRSLASIQEISTDALEGDVDADDVTAFWVAETADRPETESPGIGKWRIEAHELYAQPSTTQKVLDDARIDVGAWLGLKLADRFARAEAEAFATGDGVGKPRGFMTYDAGIPSESRWDVIERVASGDADLVTPDSLVDVVYRLKPTYRKGAVWGMTATTTAVVRKLKSSSGDYLWSDSLAAGQPPSLLGFPVVEMPELDEVGAGKEPIVFGNFLSAYQIVDRFGIRILRDPYTTKGRVKFYSTMRVGGGVTGFDALKILKIATS